MRLFFLATWLFFACDNATQPTNHCLGACDVAQTCAVTLRFPYSCEEADAPDAQTCETTQILHDCAHCVEARSCDQLRLGECNAFCN